VLALLIVTPIVVGIATRTLPLPIAWRWIWRRPGPFCTFAMTASTLPSSPTPASIVPGPPASFTST